MTGSSAAGTGNGEGWASSSSTARGRNSGRAGPFHPILQDGQLDVWHARKKAHQKASVYLTTDTCHASAQNSNVGLDASAMGSNTSGYQAAG